MALSAKAQFTLTGEIRPRVEYRHGYQSPLDSAQTGSVFTSQRTRLNFGYVASNFKVGISLQDVHVWGSESQSVSNYTNTSTFIQQAWGQYWFHSKISIKAGRQELSYDDERLFGAVNWQQQGRMHDAFLLVYEDTVSRFTAHAGIAYNQDKESNTAIAYSIPKNYKEMQFLWMHKKMNNFGISLLFLNNGAQSTASVNSTRYFQTIGTHLEYNKNKFSSAGRFYYQTGEDAAKKDMAAYMGGLDLTYSATKKFSIGIGFEMLSGQSQTDTTNAYKEKNHTFNTLYGTAHKFNGYMDYYYAGNAHGNVGLTDMYLKLKYKTTRYWISLDFHQFMAEANVLNKQEKLASGKYSAMNSNLGSEIDFTLAYNFSPLFNVQFGYSQYFTTSTIAVLKGVTDYKNVGYTDKTANWAYLMLTFKPNFSK